MVNTGQPSKGCLTCKRRRIRCDTTRPICQQCVKSNRICLGYAARPEQRGQINNSKIVPIDAQITLARPRPQSRLQTFHSLAFAPFALDLMVASAAGSRSPGAAIMQQGRISSAADELEIASSLILEVVNSGLAALRLQEQTLEERRTLLAKYGQAIRQLRKALTSCSSSEAVFFPVLLFALYEV
jgi:hypothetical protein